MKSNCSILKVILCLGLLLLILNLNAQVGTWKTYRAYQNATMVVETPNKVFAVYDRSLMAYTPADGSVQQYSKKDGMNDTGIGYMAYSSDANALVLVYENANIDILTKNGFTNISSIKNDIYIQNKMVYNLEIDGSTAYVSTSFGIVVLDLKRMEIKATYKLNKEIHSVCRFGQYLYAATTEGVYRGLLSSNLLNEDNWHYDPVNVKEGHDKNISKLIIFKDMLVFCQPDIGLSYIDNDGTVHIFDRNLYYQIAVIDDQLILINYENISFFQSFTDSYQINMNAKGISSLNEKTTFWIAGGTEGLCGIKKEQGSSEYTRTISGIKINSPKRNLTDFLTYTQDKLLVTGGGRAGFIVDNPGTLMVYEKGEWYNFDEDAIAKQVSPDWTCKDFVSATVDPRDPNHYFVASWGEGVYEFQNNEFVQLYSTNNTDEKLTSAITGNNRFVRVDGLTFDKDNNLYMTNSEVANGIIIKTANNEWKSEYYAGIAGSQVTSQQVLIDKRNQKWVNLPRGARIGILVFDDTNSTSAFSSSFTDQDGYDIGATGYFCIVEDLNGIIWVGTDNGPITFSSPANVQDHKCFRVIGTDNDGSPYRLMEGIKVTTIAVDGGNRKWLGTEGNGVFCVDMKDSKINVRNFTSENSLLISNHINSIAINNRTGEVFIATDKGLVSYSGEATSGKLDYSNVYAYPNPVRPASNDQVVITGLMENSTVKITDLNGTLITQGTSLGGQFIWNCRKRTGETVTSGIYLVMGSTPEGNKGIVTKIMVIK